MDRKNVGSVIFLSLLGMEVLLQGCLPSRQGRAPAPLSPSPVAAVITTAASGETPGSYPPDCYFNWAYKSLPDLSEQVQAAVLEIQPEAEAHAEAYGEDCIYADGHADFHALETDFFVALQATDLRDDAELGALIRRTADLLLARFPTAETPGPQPGRFNFRFTSSSQERNISFAAADYQKLPSDLTGADLLRDLIH